MQLDFRTENHLVVSNSIMMFWVKVRILLPEFDAIIPGEIYGRSLHLHYA
jgi:hypothetical protein